MSRTRHLLHLIALVAAAVATATSPSATAVGAAAAEAKLDTLLVYLSQIRMKGVLGGRVARLAGSSRTEAAVEVVLRQPPGPPELAALAAAGARVTVVAGRPAVVGRVVSARVPWAALPRLAALADVAAVESARPMGVRRALDVSVPETHADAAWGRTDLTGKSLTGAGIVVADIDSGIDVFHPAFWRADGPRFRWIDVNHNGRFDPGVDAVDLNRNGAAEANERLGLLKGSVSIAAAPGEDSSGAFDPKLDWLYNDRNRSGSREFGLGFVERLPTFGEPVFVADDANGNGRLDPGEELVQLRTCKIAGAMGAEGSTYARGGNLSQTPADVDGHGTSVCGIIAGGQRGFRRYVGLAPDAELLVASSDAEPAAAIAWAEARGARVMCHPYGSWVLQFMDGSSALEQMLDAEAEKGVVQVVAAGNLAGARRVAALTVPAAGVDGPGQAAVRIQIPEQGLGLIMLTALWREPAAHLEFALAPGSGRSVPLPGDGQERTDSAGLTIFSRGGLSSPRGTARFDLLAGRDQGLPGATWLVQITNREPRPEPVRLLVGDDGESWQGGAQFVDHVTDEGSVTWPATADRAVVVGSYSTRGIGAPAGSLSFFSGRGRRLDGRPLVTLAAPGHFDIFTAHAGQPGSDTGGWEQFSGTSASCPHVAAACALFLQRWPVASTDEVLAALRRGARADNQTGAVPNDAWGSGKLDVTTMLDAGIAAGPPPDTRWLIPPPAVCAAGRGITASAAGSDPRWAPESLSFAWRLEPGGPWSAPARERSLTLHDLKDGRYALQVRAVNPSGAEDPTPASASFCVDGTPPETRIEAGPLPPSGLAGGCVGPGPHAFRISGSDAVTPADRLRFSWRLDAGAWSDWSASRRVEVGPLTPGVHRLQARARDAAGNVDPSPPAWSFQVDAAGPEIRITPAPPERLTTGSAEFRFQAIDDHTRPAGLQFSWRLDGLQVGAWSPWQSAGATLLRGLGWGSYHFQVRARDAVGNVSAAPAEARFVVGRPAGALAGTVRDSGGRALPGARVIVSLPDGTRRVTTTDRAGQYRASNLAAAHASIVVSLAGYLEARRSRLTLRPGRTLPGVDLALRRPAALTVLVSDLQGRGLTGAAVTLSFAGGRLTAVTTAQGAAFLQLPPEEIRVTAARAGYQAGSGSVALGEGRKTSIRMKLRPESSLSARSQRRLSCRLTTAAAAGRWAARACTGRFAPVSSFGKRWYNTREVYLATGRKCFESYRP